MENYEIIRLLGIGYYGHTYLVVHKVSRDFLVLKKIECKDEMHANKAYREAKIITKIDHPYIAEFNDIFVYFDKNRISFYLVLVMKYFSYGSSSIMLHHQWLTKEKFNEEELKRWFVQTVELLIVLKKQNINHLNLRPENIFYCYEKNHLIISDFGLKTILDDERRNIRKNPNLVSWLPAFSKHELDDYSKLDVWGLGFLMFAFMTTSVMGEKEFYKLLASTKKYNLKHIEETIGEDLYDKDFVETVLSMLNPDDSLRLSITQLAGTKFFCECFEKYSSNFVKRMNRQRIGTTERPLPDYDINLVIHYLNVEKYNEFCVQDALTNLHKALKKNIFLDIPTDTSYIIVESININKDNLLVCQKGVKSLNYLAMFCVDSNHHIFSNETIETLLRINEIHKEDSVWFRTLSTYFIVLSSHDSVSARIGKLRVIEVLLNALKTFHDRRVVSTILNALWNLCIDLNNCEIAIKHGARDIIIKVFEEHSNHPEVLINAISSLLAIITALDVLLNPDNQNIMFHLLRTLKMHIGYRNLVKYTLVLIINLIEMNEEHGMEFLDCSIMYKMSDDSENDENKSDSKIEYFNGLDTLIDIYKVHDDTSFIVLLICDIILRIVYYEDLVDSLLDLSKMKDFVDQITRRYKNSKKLSKCVGKIFHKVQFQLSYL